MTALLDRLKLLPYTPKIYTLRDGNISFLMQANTHDIQIINEIWIDKIYTPWDIDAKQRWTVVDLGANKGIFSIFAAKAGWSVYAVEANPEAVAYCKANLAINGFLDRVKVLEGAIASTGGEAEFFVGKDAGQGSLVRNAPNKRRFLVKKIPIETLINDLQEVHLLKCDIEGGEYDVFLSSQVERWLPKVQRIAMEYHGSVKDLYEFFRRFDFQVILWPQRNLLYACKTGANQ